MAASVMKTVSGVNLQDALRYNQDGEENGILTQGTPFGGFSVSHNFINRIAKESRSDNLVPNEGGIGRECYSFSERENRAFAITLQEAKSIADKIGCEIEVETDTIGNLYIKIQGDSDETHMMGSHLDSVENGGMYDGVAGIGAGLETLQQVMHHKKSGTLKNSFCLAIFRSEESGPHNGMACLGSSVATGTISREKLEQIVYKTENGRDILLKNHFESSLRKYFQAVDTEKASKVREVSWGEGDDYIDHEWWYFFCEENGITKGNYVDGTWWEQITDSLKNPRITKDNTASYQELHIEQGTIIENAKVDGEQAQLGIVSGGIGGAQRYKTVESIPVESEVLQAKDYEIYSFEVLGFSDHTGSTPNNLELESSEYRRDAQIATNLFLREFLEKDFGNLVSSQVSYQLGNKNPEGYTKVPHHQNVELAIRKSKREEFKRFYNKYKNNLEKSTATTFSDLGYVQNFNEIQCLSSSSAISLISSLLAVSEVAGKEFQRQRKENSEEKQFGTTRATLTNVHLTPEGLDFHLDIREVDSSDVELLRDGISTEIQNIIPKGIVDLQKVSEKQHQKVSTELRDKAKQIAEILGYTAIYLPSIPGHDADRLAAIGVPIGMVFVRQKDGISHNPLEKMSKKDYNVACHTIMKAVLANLV